MAVQTYKNEESEAICPVFPVEVAVDGTAIHEPTMLPLTFATPTLSWVNLLAPDKLQIWDPVGVTGVDEYPTTASTADALKS